VAWINWKWGETCLIRLGRDRNDRGDSTKTHREERIGRRTIRWGKLNSSGRNSKQEAGAVRKLRRPLFGEGRRKSCNAPETVCQQLEAQKGGEGGSQVVLLGKTWPTIMSNL